jgi:hypothetical protein
VSNDVLKMSTDRNRNGWIQPFVWLAVPFALVCLPLLLSSRVTNYTWDETSYHLPAVRQIHAHWPKLDLLRDSLSATAPGYHYFLATISQVTGTSLLALRLINFLVSAGVLALLCHAWPVGRPQATAIFAIMPLAFSNFFVKSAAYLVTDNAALLTITATLLALFFMPSPLGLRRSSLWSALSVFIRQSGLWLVAPLAGRILSEPNKTRRLYFIFPPCLILGWLVLTWGGVVPPVWRSTTHATQGVVPAAGAYIFSVLALFAPAYYIAIQFREWREDIASRWTVAGAIIGLGLASAGSNAPDYEAGRWGGYLWNLAATMPSVRGFSFVFLVLSPIGGAWLGMLVLRLWRETTAAVAGAWLVAFSAWVGSALVNRQLFQRYYEPTLLVMLICWLMLIIRKRPVAFTPMIKPLALLSGAQLAITLLTAYLRTFG